MEHRVIGPPGTGKTTHLAARIRRAVSRFGAKNVMACSFTRTAAEEIAGRDTPLPPENVGTLHSLAYHACDRPEIVEVSAKARSEWNDSVGNRPWRVARTDVSSAIGDEDAPASNFGHYQDLRQRLVPRETWSAQMLELDDHWREFEADTGFTDFAGLIERAIEDHPEHPRRPAVLYVDEAQDLSPLLFRLARQWGDACVGFVLCGDPDQAIFTFAGASPDHMLSPTLPDNQRTVLSQSYRVPQSVHALARRWILAAPERREDAPYEPTDQAGSVRRAQAIETATVERAASAGTVMALAQCGYQLNRLLYALRESGTPFHNPYRRKMRLWNPLHSPMAVAVRSWVTLPHGACMSLRGFAKFARHTRTDGVWVYGARTAFERRIRALGRDDDLPFLPADLAAVWQPNAIAHYESRSALRFAQHLVDTRKSAKTKHGQALYLHRVIDRHGLDALDETPRITVGTVHSVKGGEANTVFLAPAPSPQGLRGWHQNEPGARLAHYLLMYVGMTRARKHLVLCGSAAGLPCP